MVKGIIALALASFLMVLYCCHVQGRQQDDAIDDMYQKKMGMAAGKDEREVWVDPAL